MQNDTADAAPVQLYAMRGQMYSVVCQQPWCMQASLVLLVESPALPHRHGPLPHQLHRLVNFGVVGVKGHARHMTLASVARLLLRLMSMQHFHHLHVHHGGCSQDMIYVCNQSLDVVVGRQIDVHQVLTANLQDQNGDVTVNLRRQSANAQKTYDNVFGCKV